MAKPRKKPRKKPRGITIYEQKGPQNWTASVIGSNGKHLVQGRGYNTLRIAEGGVAAAARVIKQGRVEVRRLKKR